MAVKKLHEGLSFDSAKFKKNCAEIRSKIVDLIEADEWDYMDDLSDADMSLVEEEIRDIMGLCRSFLDDFGLTESKKNRKMRKLRESADAVGIYTKVARIKQPDGEWGSRADYVEVYLQNHVKDPKTILLSFEGYYQIPDINVTNKSESEIYDIIKSNLNDIIADNDINDGKISISKAGIRNFFSQLNDYLGAAESSTGIDLEYVRKKLGKKAKIDVISDNEILVNDKYRLVMDGPKSYDVYGTRYDPDEPNGFTILSYAVSDILKATKKGESKKRSKTEAIDQDERRAIMDELVDFIKDCGVKVLKVNYRFGDIEVPREDLKDISSTVEVEFPETRRLDIHIVSASPLGKKFGKMLLPK